MEEVRKGEKVVVVPCILYTGIRKWNASDFRSLFNVRDELKKYIPNFEYIMLDVNNYSDEELLRAKDLISSVFFVTKSKNEDEVIEKLKNIMKGIGNLTREEQKTFVRWAEGMFIKTPKVYEYFEENLEKEDNKMAIEDLMVKAAEKLVNQGIAQGIEQGIVQGREEGKTKGREEEQERGRLAIKRLLNKKIKTGANEKVLSLIEKAPVEKCMKLKIKYLR